MAKATRKSKAENFDDVNYGITTVNEGVAKYHEVKIPTLDATGQRDDVVKKFPFVDGGNSELNAYMSAMVYRNNMLENPKFLRYKDSVTKKKAAEFRKGTRQFAIPGLDGMYYVAQKIPKGSTWTTMRHSITTQLDEEHWQRSFTRSILKHGAGHAIRRVLEERIAIGAATMADIDKLPKAITFVNQKMREMLTGQ